MNTFKAFSILAFSLSMNTVFAGEGAKFHDIQINVVGKYENKTVAVSNCELELYAFRQNKWVLIQEAETIQEWGAHFKSLKEETYVKSCDGIFHHLPLNKFPLLSGQSVIHKIILSEPTPLIESSYLVGINGAWVSRGMYVLALSKKDKEKISTLTQPITHTADHTGVVPVIIPSTTFAR